MHDTKLEENSQLVNLGGMEYSIRPLPRFGVLIERVQRGVPEFIPDQPIANDCPPSSGRDDLHQHLLTSGQRDSFFDFISKEGLVLCLEVSSDQPSYRKVRGKSNSNRLSPAEYYHHDGSEGGGKPLLVEIHLPYQHHQRDIATAIAPFPDVLRGMWQALPERLQNDGELAKFFEPFQQSIFWNFDRPAYLAQQSNGDGQPSQLGSLSPSGGDSHVESAPGTHPWEQIQGRITRLVRREYDPQSCRDYFREVDRLAGAFDLPWRMGESRLMLNRHSDLALTCQHRRALQANRAPAQQTGSLLKRWTAEEYHP